MFGQSQGQGWERGSGGAAVDPGMRGHEGYTRNISICVDFASSYLINPDVQGLSLPLFRVHVILKPLPNTPRGAGFGMTSQLLFHIFKFFPPFFPQFSPILVTGKSGQPAQVANVFPSPIDLPVEWHITKRNSMRNYHFIEKSWACNWCNFWRSFA